ncbi:MAG: tripartite tricarboxylate transporter TctB family protein [Paracoccus sp. (in: a-proteobacteria)]|nr:tripartite tricarboxylate transporter TctB family protein [Paracoccus sp. (in: a-proteobacteria)]
MRNRVNRTDLIIGALAIMAGLILFFAARSLIAIPGQQYGAGSMPRMIAFLSILIGAAMVWTGLRGGDAPADTDEPRHDWASQPAAWGRLLAAIGLMLFYIIASRPLGFLPVAFVIVAGMALLLDVRLWVAVLLGVVSALVLRYIFGVLLMVPLPRGEWFTIPGI